MDYLTTLNQRFEENAAKIAKLEQEIGLLKAQQQKIHAARVLHAELGFSTLSPEDLVTQSQEGQSSHGKGMPLPSLRHMINEVLKHSPQLTKDETVKAIEAHYGTKVNEATVGSTLSKMASSGEIGKAGHFAYRRKSEVSNELPLAETSSATEKTPDSE